MPAVRASVRERSWIARLAPSMIRTSASDGDPSGMPPSNESTAILEATSPAWAPPMPSATTNSGARTKRLSSLPWRWRPRSDSSQCSEILNKKAFALRSPETPPGDLRATLRGRKPRPVICVRRYSSLKSEFGVPDADAVTYVQRLRAAEGLTVEVRAVGRAQVLQHDHVSL